MLFTIIWSLWMFLIVIASLMISYVRHVTEKHEKAEKILLDYVKEDDYCVDSRIVLAGVGQDDNSDVEFAEAVRCIDY